jgi:hypothetical protein
LADNIPVSLVADDDLEFSFLQQDASHAAVLISDAPLLTEISVSRSGEVVVIYRESNWQQLF